MSQALYLYRGKTVFSFVSVKVWLNLFLCLTRGITLKIGNNSNAEVLIHPQSLWFLCHGFSVDWVWPWSGISPVLVDMEIWICTGLWWVWVVLTHSFMWLLSRASQICSSLYWLKGSRLDLEHTQTNLIPCVCAEHSEKRCFCMTSIRWGAVNIRGSSQVFLPDCPAKQDRVLGDDWQLAAEVGQSDVTDVNAIDQDGPSTVLHQPEQDHAKRRLPCTHTDRQVDRWGTDWVACCRQDSVFFNQTCDLWRPRTPSYLIQSCPRYRPSLWAW